MPWSFQNTPNFCFSSFRVFFSTKKAVLKDIWHWKIPGCQFFNEMSWNKSWGCFENFMTFVDSWCNLFSSCTQVSLRRLTLKLDNIHGFLKYWDKKSPKNELQNPMVVKFCISIRILHCSSHGNLKEFKIMQNCVRMTMWL